MAEICKVLLLGAVKAGETAFLLRYSDSQFHEAYISTVGIDYRAKEVTRYVILLCCLYLLALTCGSYAIEIVGMEL